MTSQLLGTSGLVQLIKHLKWLLGMIMLFALLRNQEVCSSQPLQTMLGNRNASKRSCQSNVSVHLILRRKKITLIQPVKVDVLVSFFCVFFSCDAGPSILTKKICWSRSKNWKLSPKIWGKLCCVIVMERGGSNSILTGSMADWYLFPASLPTFHAFAT